MAIEIATEIRNNNSELNSGLQQNSEIRHSSIVRDLREQTRVNFRKLNELGYFPRFN